MSFSLNQSESSIQYKTIHDQLLLHCLTIAWDFPHLIIFSTISSISTTVRSSNFTPFFFRHTCHANPGTNQKHGGSSSYIPMLLLWKLLNTLVSASLCRYKPWHFLRFCIPKPSQIFSVFGISICYVFLCQIAVNFFCLTMMFHWIFANYPCIHINKHLSATSNKICRSLHHRICVCFRINWLDLC